MPRECHRPRTIASASGPPYSRVGAGEGRRMREPSVELDGAVQRSVTAGTICRKCRHLIHIFLTGNRPHRIPRLNRTLLCPWENYGLKHVLVVLHTGCKAGRGLSVFRSAWTLSWRSSHYMVRSNLAITMLGISLRAGWSQNLTLVE